MKINPLSETRFPQIEGSSEPQQSTKIKNRFWTESTLSSAEEDPYNLDLSIREKKNPDTPQDVPSHGCTVNATCETCNRTDDCNHSHYCPTQNRCGHTDDCNR